MQTKTDSPCRFKTMAAVAGGPGWASSDDLMLGRKMHIGSTNQHGFSYERRRPEPLNAFIAWPCPPFFQRHLRFKLSSRHCQKFTGNGKGVAERQDDRRFEGRCGHVYFTGDFMAELKCNPLRVAEDMNRIAGFQKKSLRAGAFGCCHDCFKFGFVNFL
jgi:hypothetical protein